MIKTLQVSKDFTIGEFVDEDTHKILKDNSIWLIDPRLITAAQKMRQHFDAPLFINTWIYREESKHLNWRGFRPRSYNKCVQFSPHHRGIAIDFNVKGLTPPEVYAEVVKNYKKFGITAIEKDTPTWTHVDLRNNLGKELFIIQYKVTTVTKNI